MAWTVSAQPGGVAIEGHTVGVVVEGDPSDPNGRRIDAKPASGGHSLSSVDGAGNYHIELTGLLERGEPAEGRAFKILIQAMTSRGDQVERVEGAENARGEDALISLNGTRVVLQAVSIPVDPKPWRQLATQTT